MRHPRSDLRMNHPTRVVLQVLLDEPLRERCGIDLAAESGLTGGKIHPVLARLDGAGWVSSRWGTPAVSGGPRRRYYRLCSDAVGLARAAVLPREARSPELAVRPHRKFAGSEA